MSDKVEYSYRTIFYEFWFGFHAMIGMIGPGMNIGYSSVALPVLTSDKSETIGSNYLYDNEQLATWFASIIAIANLIGCLFCGILMKTGRKNSMIFVSFLCTIGWLVIATSNNIPQLLIGRFITGFSTGVVSTPTIVYLAEISLPQHRIIMTTSSNFTFSIGVMLIYLLGFIIPNNWRLIAYLAALIPAISTICIAIFIPESPMWLLHKGNEKKARKSLFKIRGLKIETEEFKDEFKKMIDYNKKIIIEPINSIFNGIDNVELNKVNKNSIDSSTRSNSSSRLSVAIRSFLKTSKKPDVWKPFIILNTYFFFQQFCGIASVVAYAVDFVEQSGVIADPFFITALIGMLQIIAALILVLMSAKIGTRPISLISGVGMSISLAFLIIYLKFIKGEHENYTSIPIICLFTFVLTGQFGFAAIPWTLLGELYPTKYVNILGPLTTCLGGFFNFITIQIYPSLVDIGMITTLCIYCLTSIIATIFIALFLPETRGKTNHEIEEKFRKK